ncbi:hypothetical protein [Chitinophaga pinensis]|uniref:hypothetical protein n=1 Tax=Chitinophaga pinensis TaxID=79329 RepID=UPI0039658731
MPTGADLNLTTSEDTPLSGTVTGVDADNDPLTYVIGTTTQQMVSSPSIQMERLFIRRM